MSNYVLAAQIKTYYTLGIKLTASAEFSFF